MKWLDIVTDYLIKFSTEMIDNGTNIISPACGLSMSTPVENLRVMTDRVKKCQYSWE